jgi:two-component system sensor histidine kinase DegS
MSEMQAAEERTSQEEALDILRGEIQQINAELRDINNKVNTSRSTVEQLAQRNAMVIGEVRRIEAALDQTPRLTIKETYAEALDVQQRLLTTRSQTERLQSEEAIARGHLEALEKIMETLLRQDQPTGEQEQFNAREMIMRVIDAQEEQSERLARLMHDGPAHALTNFILQAEIAQKLFDRNPEDARAELITLKGSANEAFQKVRAFIFDLRPMMLTDLGLEPTVKRYLEMTKDKTGVETEFQLVGRRRRIEHYREVLLFRGIQALVTSAREQSGASRVKVILDFGDDQVKAIVEDNGRGLGTGQLSLTAENSEALGLGALQERVNLVGGILRVNSMATGSSIEIDIPSGPEVYEGEAAD